MDRVILTLAGLGVGLLGGLLLWGLGSEPMDAPQTLPRAGAQTERFGATRAAAAGAPGNAEVEELRAQLAAEVARGVSLAREVAELRERLAQLAVSDKGEAKPADGDQQAEAKPDLAKPEGGWLDEDVLRAAGFHPADLEALRERFEEIELERLFIRDQATREGWLKKPRFRRQMARLQRDYDALRDEYGDDDYDWILYASGRTNRVVTTLVMQSSPAENAGIAPGDVIVAYDGAKILGVQELQSATTLGEPGENVAIDVLRDGEDLRFYLPVGPLGVQLKPVRSEPSTTR